MSFHTARVWIGIAAACWAAVVVAGTAGLLRYETTAAWQAEAPARWPLKSRLPHTKGAFALVMFVHPNCPCTRASLTELEELRTRFPERLTPVLVDLYRPGGETEARFFHARTSGETFLFDPGGKLVFHGGITGGRGHIGPNSGSGRIAELVSEVKTPGLSRTPVFGCSLADPTSEMLREDPRWTR